MRSVWVVDDDQSIRWVLEKSVCRQSLLCRTFENVREVMTALQLETPHLLISDIRMPGQSGLVLLSHVRENYPTLPVIIMTAYSDLESAVSAFQGGAFEYLPKPFDINKAIELIQRALLESPKAQAIDIIEQNEPEILGQALAMQDVFRAIGRLSQSHVTVLITGESGTGKELVAKALHRHSPRGKGPFIALNTAAIPKDLLESELFGHERGAFTGAAAMRQGRFEQAEGGTLFLDEIGDMSAELQTRLLRVLSDGHYYRVGGQQSIKANVRVIAATHQNLEERVKQGLFREDLFHRLNVIRLRLPSLRERQEDIPLLAQCFLQRTARELGVDTKFLSQSVLQVISQMSFPGNVRELENLCRWLTVMAPSQLIQLDDLPPDVLEGTIDSDLKQSPNHDFSEISSDFTESLPDIPFFSDDKIPETDSDCSKTDLTWLGLLENEIKALLYKEQANLMTHVVHQVEELLINTVLKTTKGRRIEAAKRLGIGRNTITRKIQELGLDT